VIENGADERSSMRGLLGLGRVGEEDRGDHRLTPAPLAEPSAPNWRRRRKLARVLMALFKGMARMMDASTAPAIDSTPS
jgi:hypothetical protein